jgi:hypothetical protein
MEAFTPFSFSGRLYPTGYSMETFNLPKIQCKPLPSEVELRGDLHPRRKRIW